MQRLADQSGKFMASTKRKSGPKVRSAQRWLRLYEDILTNPKVIRLDDNLFTAWVKLLTLAAKSDGALPSISDCALWLRKSDKDMGDIINDLIERRFIDILPDGSFRMHDWTEHQYTHDSSKERMRKHRARNRGVTGNVTERDGNASESVSVSSSEYPINSASAKRGTEGVSKVTYTREVK